MTKEILTTITLMLSLFTYAAAQGRSAKSLEGLREIGVIVKYGNSEGLAAAMQPTILQMLQDSAVDQLRLAEIPLLQSATESDLVNRPRLVLTVTVNKPAPTVPTIRVETEFYERVRLKRDTSKEMELATWDYSGTGLAQKVEHEMLFSLFEGQLDSFISDYRAVNPKPTRTVGAAPGPPSHINDNANSLQGLNGTRFYLSFQSRSFDNAAQGDELQKRLQSEAEAQLVKVGIPILRFADEMERAGRPYLHLSISLSRPKSTRQRIKLKSYFSQQVRPVRDSQKEFSAVTWESEAGDDGPITDDAVRQVMNRQLDEFIKAYKAANPNLPATSKAKAQ